jgi:hypothetical protein
MVSLTVSIFKARSYQNGYTWPVEARRLRIGSFFEWVAAAAGVIALIWLLSVPVQRILGPGVDATVDAPASLPPGVPAGATNVPVMMLVDGREIRTGDLQSRITNLLPDKLTDGPVHISAGEFGDRHTRAYLVDGTRFYVVCERLERGGPMRVVGVYLP